MGRVVHGASCPWGELSMVRVVHGVSCPWGELSMGRVVHGASCLWGELSMGRVVMGRVLMGQVVRGASCLGASGPGTHIYIRYSMNSSSTRDIRHEPLHSVPDTRMISGMPMSSSYSLRCVDVWG